VKVHEPEHCKADSTTHITQPCQAVSVHERCLQLAHIYQPLKSHKSLQALLVIVPVCDFISTHDA